jgi:orotidine-5'-phosphate decarboxylase
MSTITDKLILALDVDRAEDALALVRLLKPYLGLFKIGNQLFTREGPAIVRAMRAEGVDIFLDQKWHDIPQTVAKAVTAAAALDVRYVTVHASGGLEMLKAAQEATKGSRTEILAVTVLTSLDDGALRQIGFDRTAADQVVRLARLAVLAGVSGLVCSPHEIELIRQQIQEPVTLVTPGVRSGSDGVQDQKRTLSAPEALRRGANHLVIGRPITKATDPVAATRALLAECGLS